MSAAADRRSTRVAALRHFSVSIAEGSPR